MKDDSIYTHVLFHDDLKRLSVAESYSGFNVVARGMGKYLESIATIPIGCGPASIECLGPGFQHWRDFRFRAVVTPLSFEGSEPFGGFCGVFARYRNADDYIALFLDRHYQMKLVRRTAGGFQLLASSPLEFCLGQSLSLTIAVEGQKIIGQARPYTGLTTIEATLDGPLNFDSQSAGTCGFICSAQARLGPHTVECSNEEGERIEKLRAAVNKQVPEVPTKLEHKVPLHNLVTGKNLIFADINGDGKPEILVGQSSKKIAGEISLTRLTCLTALDLDGKILWQAGISNPDHNVEDISCGDRLPFEVHDLYGDGHPAVVCVFGYDVQVRDGKTGRVLISAGTPLTVPVDNDFKTLTSNFGKPWGDETLNMDVASISFCDTQGDGGKREILIKDDLHHLAVLDTESEPVLHALFRHRGNLGGKPWVGDLDGDGKDEIICGYSVLDHDGTLIASLPLGGYARKVVVREEAQENAPPKRTVFIAAGNEGLIALDADALLRGAYAGEVPLTARLRGRAPYNIVLARLRPELAGEQLVLTESDDPTFARRLTLLDADGALIWTNETIWRQGDIHAVRWNKSGRALLFASGPFPSLRDGSGAPAVAWTSHPGEVRFSCDVARGFCADGRDALLMWNARELQVVVPAD